MKEWGTGRRARYFKQMHFYLGLGISFKKVIRGELLKFEAGNAMTEAKTLLKAF